jgi:hypothetical protein
MEMGGEEKVQAKMENKRKKIARMKEVEEFFVLHKKRTKTPGWW